MKISGILKFVSDPVKGTSAKGDWVKQEFAVTLIGNDQYPDEILITAFGEEKLTALQHIAVGSHIEAIVDFRVVTLDSGRSFNSVNLFRFITDEKQTAPAAPAAPVAPAPQPAPSAGIDELPF